VRCLFACSRLSIRRFSLSRPRWHCIRVQASQSYQSHRLTRQPKLDSLFLGELSKAKRDSFIGGAGHGYGYSQREVADYLGLHYATVSRLANKGGYNIPGCWAFQSQLILNPISSEGQAVRSPFVYGPFVYNASMTSSTVAIRATARSSAAKCTLRISSLEMNPKVLLWMSRVKHSSRTITGLKPRL